MDFRFLNGIANKIRKREEPPIRKTKWYSQFPLKYWIRHYQAHLETIKNNVSRVASGTYDLSLLYMIQFQYSKKEFNKIKYLIKKNLC